MLRRLASALALTLVVALSATPAFAADPLLSGYGGPGGDEQVVLGSTTVRTTKTSSSDQQDPATASLKASTSSGSTASSGSSGESGGASSTLTRKPQRKKSSSSTSKDAGDDAKTTTTGGSTTAPTTLPGAPEAVAYPTRAGEVSGLPISVAGLLLVIIGVAAATLLGLGLRRFSGSDDPRDPQVPA